MGRAAQRYASVDKEDFESHVSLSSCLTDAGNRLSSNRVSAKKVISPEFCNTQDPKFQMMLAHMKNGNLAQMTGVMPFTLDQNQQLKSNSKRYESTQKATDDLKTTV